MKVTVFTSNQPRHVALVDALSAIASEVFVIQECASVLSDQVHQTVHSPLMQEYFSRVRCAETAVFGRPGFPKRGVQHLPLAFGDLNLLGLDCLAPALQSDAYVVFGSSFIRGPLCQFLVEQGAFNLHMGVSPFYRGSSTNFWALYDRRPEMVGGTIHLLTAGLDSGPILFHALPAAASIDPFTLGMKAVSASIHGFVERLGSGELTVSPPVMQDRSKELRYSRKGDFTESVVAEYLNRLPAPEEIECAIRLADRSHYVRPYYE